MINNIIKDLYLPQDNVKIEIINNVIIAEIDLDDMSSDNIDQGVMDNYMSQNALIKNRKYKAGSTYPVMSRDIAFFVSDDLGKTESDIENIIKDLVNKYPVIENYFRFDIFKKDGKTSYAYRFVFQSYEKTLTEEETKGVMGEVGGVLIGAGFEVR